MTRIQPESRGHAVAAGEQRYPQLAHWGAYTAVVRDGRLVDCEPFDQDPHPSRLLETIAPMVYSAHRVARPAVRKAWLASRGESGRELRGRDEFVEVDWDVALDLVAEEIATTRAEHGAQGIFSGSYGWSSAGRLHHARSLIRRFYFAGGGGVDQVGNYSWGTAQFLLPYVIGTYNPLTGRVTSWPSIVEHTEVFVAFGGLALKNGQVSSGGAAEHTLESWLRKLAASGARIINISPTRGDCPDFVHAEWIPIRPNTDVALMLALAHEIRCANGHDAAFLASHCVGYEALEAYFQGRDDGVAKTPEWAERITGVPAARIRSLAMQLCGKRSYLTCAFAVQRAQHGEQPYWMAIALAAMLGQIGLPGGGFGFGHGSMNGVGNPRIATPGPEMPVGRNPSELAIPVARLTEMLEQPGAPYPFQGRTQHYPDIHFIHWAGGNPFHHHQQLDRLLRAWRAKPRTVVVNEIWWTPAARNADIVLPITTSLERNDIGGSSRDRYALAMHRAIDPVGQARNDYDVFADLAERLGYRDRYTEGRDEMDWIRHIYAQFAHAQQQAGVTVPAFDEFWQGGYVKLPPPVADFVLFEEFRRDPGAHPLRTPSGRIELYSSTLASYDLPDCGGHPRWIAPREWLGADAARTYPLHLLTIQPADRLHSQMDAAPLAQSNKVAAREALRMHPDDARERGLRDGDTVRLYNARGACLAGAVLDDGVLRGTVVMATGAWYQPDSVHGAPERAGTANVLTLDIGTSSLTQGPNAMSCLVQAERWTEDAGVEPRRP
ncbi:molybdopterin guanine dinucleotide-containing S/N-oxide reductase [Achromobacter aloeverae]|uniref:Asp-tRNA(Asn)/Glu-tRNA(Gln) amidotransferase GatCAB subunit C n=1 Tax=Achromobacter aloeverae TaxID=1750518 RepID=A0A4Q1HRH2_9BURK|nr:molybdopterin guanine dinucleotide-containing S/N-oxide reductase [Achromobacter aloeverae]RXN93281.1 Asp-tRNA(Asn)/Glu-tRNA(Gln) amidotransferase GatCAB subunit C [Achromobacter aloeverae]